MLLSRFVRFSRLLVTPVRERCHERPSTSSTQRAAPPGWLDLYVFSKTAIILLYSAAGPTKLERAEQVVSFPDEM
jgi:hypothetical protein